MLKNSFIQKIESSVPVRTIREGFVSMIPVLISGAVSPYDKEDKPLQL